MIRALFERAPCYICGYNGGGYFQPETHPCAREYQEQVEKARKIRVRANETEIEALVWEARTEIAYRRRALDDLSERYRLLEQDRRLAGDDRQRIALAYADEKARAARLEGVLRKYGAHLEDCEGCGVGAACTCGFDKALALEKP